MKGDLPPTGMIAVVPNGMRKGTGLVRQTVEHVTHKRYAGFLEILKDQRNWKPYKANARPSVVQASSKTTPEKIRAGKGMSKQSLSAASVFAGRIVSFNTSAGSTCLPLYFPSFISAITQCDSSSMFETIAPAGATP